MEIHHPWDLPQYLTPTTTIVFPGGLFELFPTVCCVAPAQYVGNIQSDNTQGQHTPTTYCTPEIEPSIQSDYAESQREVGEISA